MSAPDSQRLLNRYLFRNAISAAALRGGSVLANLATGILLARALGAEQLGIYSFAIAAVSLLAVPAQFGLPTLLLREAARLRMDGQSDRISELWVWARKLSIRVSLVTMSGAAAFVYLTSVPVLSSRSITLLVAILLMPCLAILGLQGGLLRGYKFVNAGQSVEHLLRSAMFLVLLAGYLAIYGFDGFTSVNAMVVHVLAAYAVTTISSRLVSNLTGLTRSRVAQPSPDSTRLWVRAILPLALLSAAQVILQQTDVLMLGWIVESREVGIYRVVQTISVVVVFALGAMNIVLAPLIAESVAESRYEVIQQLVSFSARATTALATVAVVLLYFFGLELIRLLFGEEYNGGTAALLVLAIGQLVSAAFGSPGILLNMSGHERETAKGVGLAALANVVLNGLLIPRFGILGAAFATASAVIMWKVLLWRSAVTRTFIDCSILASGGKRNVTLDHSGSNDV